MTPLVWQKILVSCIKANELYYTLLNVAASKLNAECTTNHNAKVYYYYSFGNVAVFTTLEITARKKIGFIKKVIDYTWEMLATIHYVQT
jgi:hypothetical protein